ncbi:MAG: AraC family transcriptional regulator [Firmicutes bacterium]|nr:AraC family transcriptional regulator [Bacillota bacterium]
MKVRPDMLFEPVSYRGSLPFELTFLNIGEENKHCHREIEILLVLRGTAHYQIYHTDYELSPGDLIIADVEDLHQIHDSSEDILILSIHVDTGRFEHLYPNIRYMFFVCEECMEGPSGNRQLLGSKLKLLKQHIAKTAFDYMREEAQEALLMEDVNGLVSILVEHFQGFFMEDFQYKTSQEDLSPEDLQRLCRITRFIMLNYRKKITLDDIARMEHLSTYYLSHLIKENLGFNFQNFVNGIRLEFAEKLLVFSNMTLMQISQECGFSSPNYFNKCFSAWHGKTPSQYRKAYTPCDRIFRNDFTREEALELLSPYLHVVKEEAAPRILSLDPDFEAAPFKAFYPAFHPRITIDSAESALAAAALGKKLAAIHPSLFFLDDPIVRRNRDLERSLQNAPDFPPVPVLHAQVPSKEDLPKCHTLAEAFSCLLSDRNRPIFLTGGTSALFSPQGLEAPLYTAFRFFASLGEPEIAVCENYALVKSGQARYILLYNPGAQDLKLAISPEKLPAGCLFFCREVSAEDSCYSVLQKLGQPETVSPLLAERIRRQAEGASRFLTPQELEFTLAEGAAVILEILPPCC